jgi:RNA polymerase sigma factor (sigma-70 family)
MHQSRGRLSSGVVRHEYRVAPLRPSNDSALTYEAPSVGDLLVAEYGALMTYARRLTANGPEARDLVHMVCARVLSQATTLVRLDNVSAWLRTVLFRLFVDVRRQAKREVPTHLVAVGLPALDVDPEALLEPVVTIDDVRALLAGLPTHYRVPYEMFSFDGMSYEEISSRLGLPSRTVGTRINRARKRLRCLLEIRNG